MITEIKLTGLDNNTIRTNKKQPPKSKNENLPPCFFYLYLYRIQRVRENLFISKIIKEL